MMRFALLVLIATSVVSSCNRKGCTDPLALNYSEKAKKDDGSCTYDNTIAYAADIQALKLTYANIAYANYKDAYDGAVVLKTACENFVSNPSQSTHDAAKLAWLEARESYGQSEIFRFVEGPIDNSADGPEGLINAWPLDEAYIDYVQGNLTAGIINNAGTYPNIDMNTLIHANEFGGEANISTGYHAVEFLLWGQDFDANGAGNRPYTDYLTNGSGTADNQARRGQYLNAVCSILVLGLEQVMDAWDPNGGTYRSEWLGLSNAVALRKVFNSIRVMTGEELSGERIYTAYDNQDQEDEHSCFSDNTHRDIFLNSLGISNLFYGTYTTTNGQVISGPGLKALLAKVDPSKTATAESLRTATTTKINAMYTPFDQAIVLPAERPKVLEVVVSLQNESSNFVALAGAFGIQF